MIYRATTLDGAWIVEPELRSDDRGYFARTMCRDEMAQHGLAADFVQQNVSLSRRAGTVRGMHFQRPPRGEVKFIRCTRGALLDVIVDIRRGSPTYLKHEAFELSEANHRMLYIPQGFAHGFQTLADDTEASYLVGAAYAPQFETGLRFDDPRLAIAWPLPASEISPKDAEAPLIEGDGPDFFTFDKAPA